MAPSATTVSPTESAPIMQEEGHSKVHAIIPEVRMPTLLSLGPKFETPHEEREYQKTRLVLAFRIFAKMGFDEGVAGHITLRVRSSPFHDHRK